MKNLLFKYHLEDHGWARASFSIDGNTYELAHGYCSNPLGQLARVAVTLANRTGLCQSDVIFDNEPSGYLAIFRHRDPTQFELWECDDVLRREKSAKKMLLCEEVESVSFAISVGRALHEVYQSYGLTGFVRKWILHSFPFRQYWHLRLLLDALPLIDELDTVNAEGLRDLELKILGSDPKWTSTRLTGAVRSLDLPHDING